MVAAVPTPTHGLRSVQGYELDAVAARVGALEGQGRDHDERIRAIELEGERTRTTIKIAAGLIAATFATAAAGVGWIVVKVSERPAYVTIAPQR